MASNQIQAVFPLAPANSVAMVGAGSLVFSCALTYQEYCKVCKKNPKVMRAGFRAYLKKHFNDVHSKKLFSELTLAKASSLFGEGCLAGAIILSSMVKDNGVKGKGVGVKGKGTVIPAPAQAVPPVAPQNGDGDNSDVDNELFPIEEDPLWPLFQPVQADFTIEAPVVEEIEEPSEEVFEVKRKFKRAQVIRQFGKCFDPKNKDAISVEPPVLKAEVDAALALVGIEDLVPLAGPAALRADLKMLKERFVTIDKNIEKEKQEQLVQTQVRRQAQKDRDLFDARMKTATEAERNKGLALLDVFSVLYHKIYEVGQIDPDNGADTLVGHLQALTKIFGDHAKELKDLFNEIKIVKEGCDEKGVLRYQPHLDALRTKLTLLVATITQKKPHIGDISTPEGQERIKVANNFCELVSDVLAIDYIPVEVDMDTVGDEEKSYALYQEDRAEKTAKDGALALKLAQQLGTLS